jgi:ABC-2 type transport system permease protein
MSYLVPHSYVISAERQLLMTDPPTGGLSAAWSVAILGVFCIVTFVTGLYVFDRALRLARRLGILSI